MQAFVECERQRITNWWALGLYRKPDFGERRPRWQTSRANYDACSCSFFFLLLFFVSHLATQAKVVFFFSWKRQSSVFGASVANKCPYVTILLKKCGKGFSFCVGITCACIRVQLAFVVLQHVCSSSLYYLNYLEKSEVRMAADTSSCVVVMGIEYLELLRVLAGWDFSSRFYAAVGGNQCVVSLTYSSRLLEGPCVFRGVS